MKSLMVKANAKINLFLDITGRRGDGLHTLNMVMQSVDLGDRIILREADSGIDFTCSDPDLPRDEANLAVRAAILIKRKYNIGGGLKIDLEKRIPQGAGMAGGSTDAAGVLVGLNLLWGLGLSVEQLRELGGEIGADVPFCIKGGTALVWGIGDRIKDLPLLCGLKVLLVKPGFSISTAEAYRAVDRAEIPSHPDMDGILSAIVAGDCAAVAERLHNSFEFTALKQWPELIRIKEAILSFGAQGALMTGSGPTIFGIFSDPEALHEAEEHLCSKYPEYFIASAESSFGIEILT